MARVASLQNTDPWAKAGVMIREDLAGDAPNALAQVTAENGMTFQSRVTRGGSSQHHASRAFPGTAPQWVRLVRSGNTFTGYYSANGTAWTTMGNITVADHGAGLHRPGADEPQSVRSRTTATFSNVNVAGSDQSASRPEPDIHADDAPASTTAVQSSALTR